MQSLYEVSIKWKLLRKVNRQQLPISCNLELLFFSRSHSTIAPKISTSSRDFSVNSIVARSNWLITKLSREGKISQARKVFDEMRDRDVVSWTGMITGYVKCGLIAEARRLFDRTDAVKNVVTWTALVNGYVRMNWISEAERLFEAMPVKNVVSWNTMIDGYVRSGEVGKALELFERMSERNVVSWNTVITALAKCGRMKEATRLFDEMPERDVISWTAMVAGLTENGRVDEAREVFDRMPVRNVVSWNAMITGYANSMRLDRAFELFEMMPERDLPSWNTMTTGFIKNRQLDMAKKLFEEMPEKNIISWTIMITGYIQEDESEAALNIFVEMMRHGGVKPNEGTFVCVLSACSDLAGLDEGQQVHQMISKSVYQGRPFIVSALINMYSKCGELDISRKMFDDGVTNWRDLVSWNGMISAYAHHGSGREAIGLFNRMRALGFKPNDVSYVGLLNACSHAGLVEEGLKYFDELVKDGSIQVREDHYACLVDLCGRAGRLKEAYKFIEQLGTKPSSSIWGALLAGCNVHGDMEIGKLVADKLLTKEPENAGTYLLLSNIYASSGKWREAARVRLEMKEKGLKKPPGCSWIEVENRVHVFLVRDKSHDQSDLIHSLLHNLHAEIKKALFVPNGDFMVDEDSLAA